MTRHDTTPIVVPLKVVVIGSLQGVVNVLLSLKDSKKYVCTSAVVEDCYGINFPRYFFHSSLKAKIKSLYKIAKAYRKTAISYRSPRKVFRGIRVYFNSTDMSDELFDLVPQKTLEEADIFLVACNDTTSPRNDYKTSDYAAELMMRGISKDKIFVVPEIMTSAEIPVIECEELSPLCRKLRDVRPVMRYMEYHVTDFCNLKCKGCSHLANKTNSLEFADVDRFRLSLEKLKEKFSNITVFRILGGEPLLCKQLHEYINTAHDVFPYSHLIIVTNGLLYKNMTPETIEAIRNACAGIEVTQYPPTRKIAREIAVFCEKNGLKLSISSPVKQFYKRIHVGSNKNAKQVWFACGVSRYCHLLRDTILFPCPYLWVHSEEQFRGLLSEGFVTESEIKECSYDLTKEIKDDGWDMLMKIDRPMELCASKCSGKRSWFDWESEA